MQKGGLEIVYNLVWKNKLRYGEEKSNMVGIVDDPSNALDYETFKTYLLRNSGSSVGIDHVRVSYIKNGEECFIDTAEAFERALNIFRRRARTGRFITLTLEYVNPVYVTKQCDLRTHGDQDDKHNTRPEWFHNYMEKFKEDILKEIADMLAVVSCKHLGPCWNQAIMKPKETKDCATSCDLSNAVQDTPGSSPCVPYATSKVTSNPSTESVSVMSNKDYLTTNSKPKREYWNHSSASESNDDTSNKTPTKDIVDINSEVSTSDCSAQDKTPTKKLCDSSSDVIRKNKLLDVAFINCEQQRKFVGNPGDSCQFNWTIQNTGTTTWTGSTEIRYAWGSAELKPMKEKTPCLTLKPGELCVVVMDVMLPLHCGSFVCNYKFYHYDEAFGKWFGISVKVEEHRGTKQPYVRSPIYDVINIHGEYELLLPKTWTTFEPANPIELTLIETCATNKIIMDGDVSSSKPNQVDITENDEVDASHALTTRWLSSEREEREVTNINYNVKTSDNQKSGTNKEIVQNVSTSNIDDPLDNNADNIKKCNKYSSEEKNELLNDELIDCELLEEKTNEDFSTLSDDDRSIISLPDSISSDHSPPTDEFIHLSLTSPESKSESESDEENVDVKEFELMLPKVEPGSFPDHSNIFDVVDQLEDAINDNSEEDDLVPDASDNRRESSKQEAHPFYKAAAISDDTNIEPSNGSDASSNFAYIVYKGQKIPIAKKYLREDYLRAAEDVPFALDTKEFTFSVGRAESKVPVYSSKATKAKHKKDGRTSRGIDRVNSPRCRKENALRIKSKKQSATLEQTGHGCKKRSPDTKHSRTPAFLRLREEYMKRTLSPTMPILPLSSNEAVTQLIGFKQHEQSNLSKKYIQSEMVSPVASEPVSHYRNNGCKHDSADGPVKPYVTAFKRQLDRLRRSLTKQNGSDDQSVSPEFKEKQLALRMLHDMGFQNEKHNSALLEQFNNDLDKVITELLCYLE